MSRKNNPRQQILDAAIHLFFKQGYLATGINQVIEQAQVCKASFYSHFPSKEDLCLEYITAAHEHWMALLGAEVNKEKTSLSRLMAIFTFLEDWMRGCSYRGCGLMNISSETPQLNGRIRHRIQERNDILEKSIFTLVKDLKESDAKFFCIDVGEVTSFLLMIIQGAIVSSQTRANVVPLMHARKSFKRFLGSYLK